MSGDRYESIVWLLISDRGLSDVRRLYISSLRLSFVDKSSRHRVINLLWVSVSLIQKRFVSCFSISRRKSRNDRWSSRIEWSGREGMFKIEYKRSVLLSIIPLETLSSLSREVTERGLTRMTIELMTYWNSFTRSLLFELVIPTSNWSRTGRYVTSSLNTWLLVSYFRILVSWSCNWSHFRSLMNRQTIIIKMNNEIVISIKL